MAEHADLILTILMPVLTAIFAFGGAVAGTRVEIIWIKKELLRLERELGYIRRDMVHISNKQI